MPQDSTRGGRGGADELTLQAAIEIIEAFRRLADESFCAA